MASSLCIRLGEVAEGPNALDRESSKGADRRLSRVQILSSPSYGVTIHLMYIYNCTTRLTLVKTF